MTRIIRYIDRMNINKSTCGLALGHKIEVRCFEVWYALRLTSIIKPAFLVHKTVSSTNEAVFRRNARHIPPFTVHGPKQLLYKF